MSAAPSGPDAFDAEDFHVLQYCNRAFPNEASLEGLGDTIARLQDEYARTHADLKSTLAAQRDAGPTTRFQAHQARRDAADLASSLGSMKVAAKETARAVQEICEDIKRLDLAKRHLTDTITVLRRLSMAATAVEQLAVATATREYSQAAGLLEALNQLLTHFEGFDGVQKVVDLRQEVARVKAKLRGLVWDDFRVAPEGAAAQRSKANSVMMDDLLSPTFSARELSDACAVVQALDADGSSQAELIQTLCSREVSVYKKLFTPRPSMMQEGNPSEVARLEKLERRFAWIRRRFKMGAQVTKLFPASWSIERRVAAEFCQVTRVHLTEGVVMEREMGLEGGGDRGDWVSSLLVALQKTLDFETYLVQQLDPGHGVAEGQLAPAGQVTPARPAFDFTFPGSISSCFEPFLGAYAALEEKTLFERIDQVMREESWAPGEGDVASPQNLTSATAVFVHIRRSLVRCAQLTRGQTFFSIYKVFKKALQLYAARLQEKLDATVEACVTSTSSTGSSIMGMSMTSSTSVSKALPVEQVRSRIERLKASRATIGEADVRLVCLIINTADYCSKTTEQLQDMVAQKVDGIYRDSVDMSAECDAFSMLLTHGLQYLVSSVENGVEKALKVMVKTSWNVSGADAVSDTSGYVDLVARSLRSVSAPASDVLSAHAFRFLADKILSSFAPRFLAAIFKCKRISQAGAQLLLLDTIAMKQALLAMGADYRQGSGSEKGSSSMASYDKYVHREISRHETILKVLLAPAELTVVTYRELIPEGAEQELDKVCSLKGLKAGGAQGDHHPGSSSATAPGAAPRPAPSAAATPAGTQSTSFSDMMKQSFTFGSGKSAG